MDNYATWIVVVSNRSRNKLSQQPPLSIFPKRKHKGFLSSILGNENSWTPEREVKGKSCPRLTIRQIRKEETNPSLKLWFLLSLGILQESILHVIVLTGGLLWMALTGAEEKVGIDCLSVCDCCSLLMVFRGQLTQGWGVSKRPIRSFWFLMPKSDFELYKSIQNLTPGS